MKHGLIVDSFFFFKVNIANELLSLTGLPKSFVVVDCACTEVWKMNY